MARLKLTAPSRVLEVERPDGTIIIIKLKRLTIIQAEEINNEIVELNDYTLNL